MTRKYQIWVYDSKLAGHILCEDNETVDMDDATDYARRVWDDDIKECDVSICEISLGYYQELANSTAKDSIILGM